MKKSKFGLFDVENVKCLDVNWCVWGKMHLNARWEIVTLALYPSLSTVWLRYFQQIRMLSCPPNTNLKIIVHVLKLHPEKEKSWPIKGLNIFWKNVHEPWRGYIIFWKSSWIMLGSLSKMGKFMNENCNSSVLIQFDPIWSNLILFDPIRSILIQLVIN